MGRVKNSQMEGKKFYAICNTRELSTNNTAPYPGWYQNRIPVLITGEYDNFFSVDVLSHRNPDSIFGNSKPYSVTIDKIYIKNGEFQLIPMDANTANTTVSQPVKSLTTKSKNSNKARKNNKAKDPDVFAKMLRDLAKA